MQWNGTRESNPLVAWAAPMGPGPMLTIGEGMDVLLVWTLHRWLHERDPALLRGILYAASAVRLTMGISNWRLNQDTARLMRSPR